MRNFLALLLISFTTLLHAQDNEVNLQKIHNIKRIAFGSCNDQNDVQPLWKDMMKQRPDLFIWGGDTIYADWGKSESVARAYKKQNEVVDFRDFKKITPMIGTWDDHDYAFNNAGGDISFKKESQRMFLDFFEVPLDSPRRTHEGVYHSYEFGDPGKRIKIILLDNRYFKGLDPRAPLLGEAQWLWLENELKTSTASLHFIMAGLPIFGPLIPYTEEWAEYPVERDRLLGLLKTYKTMAPVFLTGDKHFSSIYKRWGQLEFMSSGMTHVADRRTWWYLGRKYPVTYFGESYGQIDIDWDGTTPLLTLVMRNAKGRDIHKKQVRWKTDQWMFEVRQ